jgi:two-component system, OmpR family, KDP operon response regulator KdpE
VSVVALVEDDQRIRSALQRSLSERGFLVVTEGTGLEGLRAIIDERPDVVLLDLGLPDVDGLDVLKMVRAVSSVPVIVVTARDAEAEIVQALDLGADDYVSKPFSADQIVARIRAVLRRAGGEDVGLLEVGELRVDPRGREAWLGDRRLDLNRREFDLLCYLAQRAGVVVSKSELLAEVWRQPYGGADKTVDVHLSWLRRKLGESAATPVYLHTMRGVGVKLGLSEVPDG